MRAKYDRFPMAPFARVRRLGAHARHRLSSDRSVAPGVLTVDQSAITQTLRRRAAVAEASLRWFESSSARPRPESRSQYGEDALLWGLFDEQDSGFFVEAGAFDGYEFSVTYLFECAGWQGLLVEPIPELARACRERRTSSRVVNVALSRPGEHRLDELTVVTDEPMLSYLELTPAHRARLERADDLSTRAVKVPVRTLDELLADHGGDVDFVVLDVEGGELAALEGFSLDRWRPRALLVEDQSLGAESAICELMAGHGYARVATYVHNDLYLRADDTRLSERFQRWWRCTE